MIQKNWSHELSGVNLYSFENSESLVIFLLFFRGTYVLFSPGDTYQTFYFEGQKLFTDTSKLLFLVSLKEISNNFGMVKFFSDFFRAGVINRNKKIANDFYQFKTSH